MDETLEKKFYCKYCGLVFFDKRKLAGHVTSKHIFKQCDFCGKIIYIRNFNTHKEKCLQRQIENSKQYYCEKCGKLVTKKFGSGRFCSRKCANSRILIKETRQKISNTVKNKNLNKPKKHKNYCIDCGKEISFYAKRCNSCNKRCLETKLKLSKSAKKKKFFNIDNSTDIFYGYIYLTENLLDGSVYIGQHFTKNNLIKDNYYGSGIHLRRAIKKYGKKNFKKSILFSGNCCQAELNQLEKYYIWLAKHNNNGIKCYNIASGGRGTNL